MTACSNRSPSNVTAQGSHGEVIKGRDLVGGEHLILDPFGNGKKSSGISLMDLGCRRRATR